MMLGRLTWLFWIGAPILVLHASVAWGATLIVSLHREDDQKPREVDVVLTKYSPGSDGCCEESVKKAVRFEPGVRRREVAFENLEACSRPVGHCTYRLTWRGATTLFGSIDPEIRGAGVNRLADVLLQEGRTLGGALSMQTDWPYRQAFIKLFHPLLPRGEVSIPIAEDGTFAFVGIPATEGIRWEFSSLNPSIMKQIGVLKAETTLTVPVKAAQNISGCLTQGGRPIGAAVSLSYETWPTGLVVVGSAGAGADGCFKIWRDREFPADLRIDYGSHGPFRIRFARLDTGAARDAP